MSFSLNILLLGYKKCRKLKKKKLSKSGGSKCAAAYLVILNPTAGC